MADAIQEERSLTRDEAIDLACEAVEIDRKVFNLLTAPHTYLNATINNDEEGADTWLERMDLTDEEPDQLDEAAKVALTDEIDEALTHLPERDAEVLKLYFGLNGYEEHTLEEIGGIIGVTRERIRQLRDRALKTLREHSVGSGLATFVED